MKHKFGKRGEKKMINDFKKKLENYWYYYKLHTIAAIFVVIVIIVSITSAVGNKQPVLNVDLVGKSISEDARVKMEDKFNSELVKNPKQTVSISFMQYDSSPKGDPQMNSAVINKIMATTASKELDVIIIDKDTFDSYVKQGMFLRIDKVSELGDLGQTNLKFIDGKQENDKENYHYGIDVSDNEMLKATGYDTNDKVLGIVSNSTRKDISSKFIKILLNIK